MSIRVTAALLALGLCAACAGSPRVVLKMAPEELAQQPTENLLHACERSERYTPNVVRELSKRQDIYVLDTRRCPYLILEFVNRGEIQKEFVEDILRGQISVGMTTTEMRLAWGEPQRSRGGQGGRAEHVYGFSGPVIYTENGVVTGYRK